MELANLYHILLQKFNYVKYFSKYQFTFLLKDFSKFNEIYLLVKSSHLSKMTLIKVTLLLLESFER